MNGASAEISSATFPRDYAIFAGRRTAVAHGASTATHENTCRQSQLIGSVHMPPNVPKHKILQVAGAVPADPKTVRKVLDGKPVRGSVGDRIVEELKRRGLR